MLCVPTPDARKAVGLRSPREACDARLPLSTFRARELTTRSLASWVYPRGHKCKLWYLTRIATQFADRTGERRWPDGNVWRKK